MKTPNDSPQTTCLQKQAFTPNDLHLVTPFHKWHAILTKHESQHLSWLAHSHDLLIPKVETVKSHALQTSRGRRKPNHKSSGQSKVLD
jgi:hypothetical protein